MKNIKLFAYEINNSSVSSPYSDIMNLSVKRLNSEESVNDRRMRINIDDPQKEEDLISNYDIKGDQYVFLTLLRIASSEGLPNITDDLLRQDKISITDLDSIKINGSSNVYKYHHYYAFNNKFLVTNSPLNRKIKGFQTYINWFLKETRGSHIFEFTPIIVEPEGTSFKDLRSIRFKDSSVFMSTKEKQESPNSLSKRIRLFKEDIIKSMLSNVVGMEEILEKILYLPIYFLNLQRRKEYLRKIIKGQWEPLLNQSEMKKI